SIIAESLNNSVHVKGPHGYGSLNGAGAGSHVSFHHNLWAHHLARSPRPGNPLPPERDPVGSFQDYRSNVFYDWGGNHSGYNADTGPKASLVQYNFVDNTYLPGAASGGAIAFDESNELAHAWFAGNSMNGVIPEDPWSLVSGKSTGSYRLSAPVDVAPVRAEPAARAFESVLRDAGASRVRDAVDLRIVQSVRDRSGALINSQKDVGGWPNLASLPAKVDTDHDGMPDEWERAHGLDRRRADGNEDANGDGYTNLDDYLNSLAGPRLVAAADRVKIVGRSGGFSSLQSAVDALPAAGGEILLAPGEYREKVRIDKPGVRLRGLGSDPSAVVIVWGDGAIHAGGTVRSATLQASGDDFRVENLTIQNDYSLHYSVPSQAVALSVTGDRVIVRKVRLLGAQDTLYAASRKCAGADCRVSRQYFRNCYIEGHVDFIFGDSKAFFDRCEIHAIAHDEIMLTAHARTAPDQDRAYVFDHCTITGDAAARDIYFGRPWRDYAAVVFMNSRIEANLNPAGWREWTPGTTQRLQTAYYAEYRSKGPHADVSSREPLAHQLSAAEAAKWQIDPFLVGTDGWRPDKQHWR
ncbi:MAG TPA: pectinesterase family protein, partial [Povalibacter sp.]|nr:pectinesterase family protein [Povalibacter sp.]